MSETPATYETNALAITEANIDEILDFIEVDKTRNDVEYMFMLKQTFNHMERIQTIAFFRNAATMAHCKRNKNFKQFGTHIHNMNDLFNEFSLSYKTGTQYINMYNRYIDLLREHPEILNIAIGKLQIMMTLKNEELFGLLESAKTDPRRGFEDKVKVIKNKPPTMECSHADFPQELWQRCSNCGSWKIIEKDT